MIRAGKLNRFIELHRESQTVTPTGAVQSDWHGIRTIKAEVVETSLNERPTGFGQADFGTMIIQIRYDPDIQPSDRILYWRDNAEPQFFDIKDIEEIGRYKGLRLILHRRPQ